MKANAKGRFIFYKIVLSHLFFSLKCSKNSWLLNVVSEIFVF